MDSILSTSEYLLPALPELWFGFVLVAFGGYLLLDGFDFGLGMLYHTATASERATLRAAFGPIWKANEVWLVLFGTVLFAGFPRVYAQLLSTHYLLVFALLFALSMRGLGSKLRGESTHAKWTPFWDRAFVAGSLFSPFLLGMLAGSWALGAESPLTPGPIFVGLTLMVLSLMLGASFLAVKTEGALQQRMATRSRWASIGYLGILVLTAASFYQWHPDTQAALLSLPTVLIVLGSVGAGAAVYRFQQRHLHRSALFAAASMAVLLIGLVAYLMYPFVYPAEALTVRDAVVSPLPMNVTFMMAAIFFPVILLYFGFLYSVFSGPARPEDEHAYS